MTAAAIGTLLVLSAVAEVFGTVTVAVNYYRGHVLASAMREELAEERALEGPTPAMYRSVRALHDQPFAIDAIEDASRALRTRVVGHLSAHALYTAGLASYVLGALLGLTAGLLALNH